ncbi:50S ribosomal protein L27 [Candidatus Uhrbacteria bacterium RIFCSPHIGHO2_01_FULL_63_20]|uniref:Large ribosomal subunit protein bL27 n=1 Tax=Candidatus Uhrbacteria bacterium RIFCSPHIGHO2_01_FULL_63_20 TaxID=1802385 RepID=A0A1F7TKS7_9BACT|nr:MAG: 50S ribosomal protein L27 [Candidatus Uhrbacteria bacterium RIFCSPHIGHO2_01_FULL_63_20]
MAHKKAAGSTQLGRDSHGQRLGVKVGDGEHAGAGQIIVRQRGTPIRPGTNVEKGVDDTLYAKKAGFVKYTKKQMPSFTGKLNVCTFCNVIPEEKK